MKVTREDVHYVAELAQLELTREERQRYERDLRSILEYVEMLNEVDTGAVEPYSHALATGSMPLRDDRHMPGLGHESALMNAPETNGELFEVPKVVERPGDNKK